MALDIKKNPVEKVDISFVTERRSPKTKKASEVKSPFVEELPNGLQKEENTEKFEIDSIPELKDAPKKDLEEKIKFKEIDVDIETSHNFKELHKIKKLLGSSNSFYYLLLKELKDKDNCLKYSQNKLTELLCIKDKKNIKKILNDLELKGVITLKKEFNSKDRVERIYIFNEI